SSDLAELVPSILGFFTHESLSAQCDVRLVSFTVPVVLVALTVQLYHLDYVLFVPKNIVVEETIPIVGSLFCNFWRTNGRMPNKRWNVVQWTRRRGKLL